MRFRSAVSAILRAMLAIGAMLALAPTAVWSQGQSGRLTGKVLDEQGTALPGVTVEILSSGTDLRRSVVTGEQGDYLLPSLPIGSYQVTFALEGWEPQSYNVRISLGETVPLNVTLAQGAAVTEQIDVTAPAPAMQTTASGQNFDYREQVDKLPMPARDFESVAGYSPNISFGPTPGTYVIAGAPSYDTTVLLDGAEVSDPYFGSSPDLITEDATDEVQVLTTGLSARWGRFQGGIINAVTKSGTNDFSGRLTFDVEKDSWNSTSPAGETLSDDLQKTYQATFGGPLLQDRFWFFVSGRTFPETSTNSTAVTTRQTISTVLTEDRYQGKLSAALTPAHLVDMSYAKFDAEAANRPGLTAGEAQAVGLRTDPRELWTASYSGILNENNVVDLRLTQKDVNIFEGATNLQRDPFIDYFASTVYNNGWWDGTDPSNRSNRTAAASLTSNLDGGHLGDHLLEAGVQWVESTTGGDNRQSATGYNLLALNSGRFATYVNGQLRYNMENQYMYRWVALGLGAEQKNESNAVYAHDQWNLNERLRVDAGLRYEQMTGTSNVALYDIDFDGFAPRIGLTWSVRPDTQVQATWGRYIARFNDNIGNNVSGVSNAPRIETLYTGPTLLGLTADQVQALLRNDANWGVVTSYGDPADTNAQYTFNAVGLDAPYADEIGLSVRHALPQGRGSLVLQYVSRDYEQIIEDFTGAVCDEYGLRPQDRPCQNITPVAAADTTFDTVIWANSDRARRKYDGLSLIADLALTRNLRLSGNYTFAETKGNYEGEARNQPAIGTQIGNFERAYRGNPDEVAFPYGPTDDDIRHRANVLATYSFDQGWLDGLTLGGIFQYQSGYAYSLTGSVPMLNLSEYRGDGGIGTTYTHFFGGRGSRRFDGFWSLDLSARYDFRIVGDLGAFVRVMATNATDEASLVRFQTTGRAVRGADGSFSWAPTGNCGLGDEPSPNCTGFGRIRNQLDYQTPRSFQASVGIRF